MTSLKGKTLFVSGGSRGIGLALLNSGSSSGRSEGEPLLVLPIGQLQIRLLIAAVHESAFDAVPPALRCRGCGRC